MTAHAAPDIALLAGARSTFVAPWVRWLALLGLCAAYLQGGIDKAIHFSAAVAEMQHFGLAPAAPLAMATIMLELGCSAMVLAGWHRWLGALALAGFTLVASFVANRFWELPLPQRVMAANAFFEHLGLVGGFVLVAWHDLRSRAADRTHRLMTATTEPSGRIVQRKGPSWPRVSDAARRGGPTRTDE